MCEAERGLHGDLFVESHQRLKRRGGNGAAHTGDRAGGCIEGDEHGIGHGAETEGVECAAVAVRILLDEPGLRPVGDGALEKVARGGREHAAASHRRIEQTGAGELDVAHRFRRHPEARAAGEFTVLRIILAELFASNRILPVGGTGGDEVVDVLHVPTALHELAGEPIQKFRMRRRGSLVAEILRGLEQPDTEIRLPDTVHKDAGRDGRLRIDEPFREGQARLGITRRQRVEEGGHVWFDDMLRMRLLAALEEMGDAFLLRLGGNERPCRRGNLRVERLDPGGLGGEVGVGFPPVGEEALFLLRGAFPRIC